MLCPHCLVLFSAWMPSYHRSSGKTQTLRLSAQGMTRWGQHLSLGHTELGRTSHNLWLTVPSLRLFASHPRACPLCAHCPSCSTRLPLLLWEGKCFPFPLPFCSPAASESGFPCALPPRASGTTGKCIKGLGKAAVRVTHSHSWIQLLL